MFIRAEHFVVLSRGTLTRGRIVGSNVQLRLSRLVLLSPRPRLASRSLPTRPSTLPKITSLSLSTHAHMNFVSFFFLIFQFYSCTENEWTRLFSRAIWLEKTCSIFFYFALFGLRGVRVLILLLFSQDSPPERRSNSSFIQFSHDSSCNSIVARFRKRVLLSRLRTSSFICLIISSDTMIFR